MAGVRRLLLSGEVRLATIEGASSGRGRGVVVTVTDTQSRESRPAEEPPAAACTGGAPRERTRTGRSRSAGSRSGWGRRTATAAPTSPTSGRRSPAARCPTSRPARRRPRPWSSASTGSAARRPAVNLESPATLQVAGDARAGFYRAWFPGGTAKGRPLQEAYCWGHLDTAWWTALWLLLLPFGLLNLAHWALPRDGSRTIRYAARALLRLLGLVLTDRAGRDRVVHRPRPDRLAGRRPPAALGLAGLVRGLGRRRPDGARLGARVRRDRRPVVAEPAHPGRLRGPSLGLRRARRARLGAVRPVPVVRLAPGQAAAQHPPRRGRGGPVPHAGAARVSPPARRCAPRPRASRSGCSRSPPCSRSVRGPTARRVRT